MLTENKYIPQLTDSLKALDPHMVLLFGSYAYGSPKDDSDIDLLVVTNDSFIPKDYNEYTQLYLKVSKAIRPVKKLIAVDLIVHTLPMYHLFIEQNSSFCNEIVSKGKIIYESNHPSMA
jgi:uncharacterized protein